MINKEFAINAKKHPLYAIVSDGQIVGCTMGGLHLTTEFAVNKFYKDADGVRTPNPHHGKIIKKQIVSCHIGTENVESMYANKINKQLDAAGSTEKFVPQQELHADKLENSAIWVNRKTGQAYLRYYPNMQNKANAKYYLDGKEIDYNDILGKAAKRKQYTVEKQDTDGNTIVVDKPQIRKVCVENVDIANLLGGSHAPNLIADIMLEA